MRRAQASFGAAGGWMERIRFWLAGTGFRWARRPEQVLPVLREVEIDVHLAVRVQDPVRAADEALPARLRDLLRLEPGEGRLLGGDRLADDLLRGGQVLLHQDRREGEDVADVVE